MDVNSERRIIIPWRPFPKDNIFDPVPKFEPDQTCEYLKRGAPSEALVQISNFCFRVSALLRHVNTLSWLYVLWSEKMDSTGRTLPEEDKSMTTILIRMHAHIHTGKRFNETSDKGIPRLMPLECTNLVLLESALTISDVSIGQKSLTSNQSLSWFSKSGNTGILKIPS